MPNLTQSEIELLSPEEYSNYLAYGESLLPAKLTESEYEEYILAQREFDL
jgi:hypothetical protein